MVLHNANSLCAVFDFLGYLKDDVAVPSFSDFSVVSTLDNLPYGLDGLFVLFLPIRQSTTPTYYYICMIPQSQDLVNTFLALFPNFVKFFRTVV